LILSLILSMLPGFSFSQDDPQPAKGGYDVTQVTYKNPAISTRFSGGLWYKGNKQWVHRLLHVNGSLNDGYYQEVGRDEWSVYLEKVTIYETTKIHLDLWRKKVTRTIIVDRTKTVNQSQTVHEKSETSDELGDVTYAVAEDLQVLQDELKTPTAYHFDNPVTEEELDEVMRWIGRELSRSEVDYCWKDTYGRGAGYTTRSACEASDEAAGVGGKCEQYITLWYPVCKEGYQADGCCICSWKCDNSIQRGQNIDCGAGCAYNDDECALAISNMVFAPIFMALNIASFGLGGAAKKAANDAAKEAAQQIALGANSATGGAANVHNGIIKIALQKNWGPLLTSLWNAEKYVEKIIDTKDKIEYLNANVENFATELERWNNHYADNFQEYTNERINLIIDQKFTRKDDRIYVKRRFGQYMLISMLESDGWRIAKTILSAAAIEPSGVVATIDAFAHPICKTEANPFPSINIIPKGERGRKSSTPITPQREPGKVYKTVHFHSQASLSLAQALSIAKQNSWMLATATEVQEAWLFNNLNVYAYGRMADGRFSVPVQTDHSNFKRGANIGAMGGNQGFFYIKLNNAPPKANNTPLIFPPLNNGYVRIQNKSNNTYLHNQTGKPENGQIQANWASAQWKIVKYGGQLVNIQSSSNPGLILNNNNGVLEVVNIANNRSSALWELRRSNESGWVLLQSSWNPSHYIHIENGKLEIGPIQSHWSSALWKVE
ncbi:MAG: RICIN domain-containing protein, partial [Bacteroidetes bacterium]|nr:RICIN domain-containing protein [Bacteroidota bacterium]